MSIQPSSTEMRITPVDSWQSEREGDRMYGCNLPQLAVNKVLEHFNENEEKQPGQI